MEERDEIMKRERWRIEVFNFGDTVITREFEFNEGENTVKFFEGFYNGLIHLQPTFTGYSVTYLGKK